MQSVKPKKVLIIGSGPIVIGQAAEFDYAGTQACKAMREEGVTSVLVNSNPATIMTDEGIADIVYIEPLTVEVIERIIAKERPDGLLPTLGGQTGLNLAVALADAGVLEKYNVRLLGTPLETIRKAEDRELFKELLIELGEPVPVSATVTNMDEARKAAEEIGLPLVVRPAYTLGGTGGGFVNTMEELETVTAGGLSASPIHQVLLERSLVGWKEVEYEVMRDSADNCITVCNMENFDPMGVHTGDSIVVAPSQTLTDKEYQMLRSASLKIIRALGIEGGCNIQFGMAPRPVNDETYSPDGKSTPYVIIEVNPRVSRSSALASKATGYPIARVAAKIAVGRRLDEITNQVTGSSTAAFEPALDYCVVKIPRWPFDKFASGDRTIGTQMKATGEVMAIGRSFEVALQKAIRSLEFGSRSLLWEDPSWREQTVGDDGLPPLPLHPTDERLWALLAALRRGASIHMLNQRTGIDPWFLTKLDGLVQMERRLLSEALNRPLMVAAKRMGFSDSDIAQLGDTARTVGLVERVRALRIDWKVVPVYKMVDTCAAEFAAATPYFYSDYDTENEAIPDAVKKALVLGSGPIRIGQGIEFDYCSVHAAWALEAAGVQSIMVNSNPETVSTDFDTSHRLYFEPLDEESVRDILANEAGGIAHAGEEPPSITQFGGQTAINLAGPLHAAGLPLLGSSADTIDLAEDRRRFEAQMNHLGVPQPPGAAITKVEEAAAVADSVGYPVLVRPSYVLGGRAMEIVYTPADLQRYMSQAVDMSQGKPILIDKYLEGKEVEVDAICDGVRVLIPGIMEHIERAGVHSGDSMAVYPAPNLTEREIATIVDYTKRMALGLNVRGLMNVQYVIMPTSAEDAEPAVYVIEVNPRASRTVPFLAKVTGVPMVRLATSIMLGQTLEEMGFEDGLWPAKPLVAIKAPVFSMSKLVGVDTYLGPEMKSTGEVMGIDSTFEAALTKALMSSDLMIQPGITLLVSIADRDKEEATPILKDLHNLGCHFYATEGTAALLRSLDIPVDLETKKIGLGSPDVVEVIRQRKVSAVVNTVTGQRSPLRDGFEIRRAAAEMRMPCFTSLDTVRAATHSLQRGEAGYDVRPLYDYVAGPRK